MWKLKPSPRTIKATEKYIASLGRKREELTEEQWNLMVTYTQNRRAAIPFLMIFCLACGILMLINWHLGHKYLTKIIPHQSIQVIFDGQKEPIVLTPQDIQQYLDYVIERYFSVGSSFAFTIILLTFFVISLTIAKTFNRKGHKILLSRPATTESVT